MSGTSTMQWSPPSYEWERDVSRYDVTFTFKNAKDASGENLVCRLCDVRYADVPHIVTLLAGLELEELTLVHVGKSPGEDCRCTPCSEGGGLDLLANYGDAATQPRMGA